MNAIHISTARTILNAGDPVSLSVWKADGSIMHLENVISVYTSYTGGWRNIRILASGQTRRIRDCCIFRLNGLEVYM